MSNLEDFFTTGISIHASKGEVVLRGDEENADIFYLSKGLIKVYSINDEGEEYIHIIYKTGDIFPLIWAFRNKQRRVFYESLASSVLWKVPKARFLGHIKENTSPEAYSLIEQLAEQFNVYADRVDNLQYKSASQRVVYRLLFLAGRFGKKDGNRIIIDAPITHKIIASSINLTRESVSREIEKLDDAGIISTNNGKIVIKDVKKLGEQFSEPVSIDLWGLQ
jgi:CRP/FNR family transcriptional regulator